MPVHDRSPNEPAIDWGLPGSRRPPPPPRPVPRTSSPLPTAGHPMPDSPTVTVLMPVRNGEATLARAITSVQAQTSSSWELLLVDDRSTDDTPRIAAEFAAADSRIRVHQTASPLGSRGLVAALDTGCREAAGRFIARLDADDECLPDRLARQVDLLERTPELGVVGCLVDFGGDPVAAAGYARHVAWTNSLLDHRSILLNRFVDSPLPHPSVMFRRDLAERLGAYRDGPFPEDHELWLRWLDAGVRFGKVPEVLLRWNDPPDRLSRTDPRYSIEATSRLRCRHLAIDLERRDERRPLWLWGSGRVTRRRFDTLVEHGISIAGFIDIDSDRIGQRSLGVPVVGPDRLPDPGDSFILSGVGVRGAREEIRTTLLASGRREGRDFLMMA
jgi:glycosyltransferase involved in cell wall biosynthesis